jgi:two-component system CheB/CheR fusion protein
VVNHNLLSLDIGLPIEQLKRPLRAVIAGESEMGEANFTATNRRGRKISVHMTITPLSTAQKEIRAAILLAEQVSNTITDTFGQ